MNTNPRTIVKQKRIKLVKQFTQLLKETANVTYTHYRFLDNYSKSLAQLIDVNPKNYNQLMEAAVLYATPGIITDKINELYVGDDKLIFDWLRREHAKTGLELREIDNSHPNILPMYTEIEKVSMEETALKVNMNSTYGKIV